MINFCLQSLVSILWLFCIVQKNCCYSNSCTQKVGAPAAPIGILRFCLALCIYIGDKGLGVVDLHELAMFDTGLFEIVWGILVLPIYKGGGQFFLWKTGHDLSLWALSRHIIQSTPLSSKSFSVGLQFFGWSLVEKFSREFWRCLTSQQLLHRRGTTKFSREFINYTTS